MGGRAGPPKKKSKTPQLFVQRMTATGPMPLLLVAQELQRTTLQLKEEDGDGPHAETEAVLADKCAPSVLQLPLRVPRCAATACRQLCPMTRSSTMSSRLLTAACSDAMPVECVRS
jgi:hypothetical protein